MCQHRGTRETEPIIRTSATAFSHGLDPKETLAKAASALTVFIDL